MNRLVFIGMIIGTVSFGILLYHDWVVAACVFGAMFGNNLEREHR